MTAVTAGGLVQEDEVLSSKVTNIAPLQENHEEADTCVLLHVCHTGSNTVFICNRDNGVLILLIVHSFTIHKDIYMKVGTSKAPQFIPVYR